MNSRINPFFAVRIGASVNASNGRMGTSVLSDKPITKLHLENDTKTSMTGESNYVYSDQLNQGSMGIAGSYGTAAASKISAAVSAYAGKSSADSTNAINLNYNIMLLAGVEYINFDDLTPDLLLSSLKESPKQHAEDALDKFINVNKLLNGKNLIETLKDPKGKTEIEEAVKEWYEAIETFFSAHGDGMVVGVIWGGMGTVGLSLENKSQESNWKYGGKGNFSYAGVGSSLSVEAAYDGSQRKALANVKVSVSSWASGGAVESQVKAWRESLEKMALDKLATTKPLESAPKVSELRELPKVPDFEKPEKEATLASKIDTIKDMAGLKTFAMASAYDKAKKESPELTLNEFIKKAESAADISSIVDLKENVEKNNIEVLSKDIIESKVVRRQSEPLRRPSPRMLNVTSSRLHLEEVEDEPAIVKPAAIAKQKPVALTNKAEQTGAFTVLGVWIANWADLFPWLATGYLNNTNSLDTAKSILKKQCMMQDMLTLSKLYRIIHSTGISYSSFGFSSDFEQIADNFGQQVELLKDKLTGDDNVIREVFNKLSADAREIYTTWDSIKFLRDAELGLGLLVDGKSNTDSIAKQEIISTYTHISCSMEPCSFHAGGSYSPFSKFMKLLPLITPKGEVYAFGPAGMLLKEAGADFAIFSRNKATALKLDIDINNKILKKDKVQLYPIPFSGAKGITSWRGQSFSTNLAANRNLQERLGDIKKQIEALNMYSFSSDNWKKWKPGNYYSINAIKTQYVGIIEPVQSVFNNR